MNELSQEFLLTLIRNAREDSERATSRLEHAKAEARRHGVPEAVIAEAAGERLVAGSAPDEPSVDGDHDANRNVVVVAANRAAYDEYHRFNAYMCQTGRSFRDTTERVGFYRFSEIRPEFPAILHRRDHVQWTPETATRLREQGALFDAEIADLIDSALAAGIRPLGGYNQVLLLAPPDDEATLRLASPIRHNGRGRGSAWTRGTRYVAEAALRQNPATTDDL